MPEIPQGKAQLATQIDDDAMIAIRRLAKAEGISHGELIARLVRAYDETPVPEPSDAPDGSTITVYLPRDRDMMAAAFVQIIDAVTPFMHENTMLSAIGLARTHIVKGLPEYQDAEAMRQRWQFTRDNGARPLTYVPPLKSK